MLSFLYSIYKKYQKDQQRISDKKRLDLELEITHSIQQNILAINERVPGIQTSHLYLPADSTSGDWYGQYYIEESHTAYFFCGDVTGHGITQFCGQPCGWGH